MTVFKVLRERIGPDPRLNIIENGHNLGFAKAVNIGLRRATADYYLILNPDCLVQPDTLAKVINSILLDPEVTRPCCVCLWSTGGSTLAICRG